MHDELKKSSGYLIRPGDRPEPAARVTSAAAVDGTFNRKLPAESGAAQSAGTGTRGGRPHFARQRSEGWKCSRERRPPTSSQRSTGPRLPGALISWAMRGLPADRGNILP